VGLDRVRTRNERSGDLGILFSGRHQPQHFRLAVSQPRTCLDWQVVGDVVGVSALGAAPRYARTGPLASASFATAWNSPSAAITFVGARGSPGSPRRPGPVADGCTARTPRMQRIRRLGRHGSGTTGAAYILGPRRRREPEV
jgi:hypothetical protein